MKRYKIEMMHQDLMQVMVTLDKLKYNDNDEAVIVVSTNDYVGPIEGVAVKTVVTASNGFKQVGASMTRCDGKGTILYEVNVASGGPGIYAVDATAQKSGFDIGRGSTSFEVVN